MKKLTFLLSLLALLFLPISAFAESATIIDASQKDRWTNGLVGYWTFDRPDMDWSQSTAEARDQSGQNNHGDVVGPTVAIGQVGQALSFDGSGDYVETEDNYNFNLTYITVSAWVKANEVGNGTTHAADTIVQRYDLGEYGWKLGVDSSGKPVWLYYSQGCTSDVITSSGASVVGSWHHLLGVRSSTGLELFVDGISKGTDTQACSDLIQHEPVLIGRWKAAAAGADFNGTIDEVRIYNRALSADEIETLYNLGAREFLIGQ